MDSIKKSLKSKVFWIVVIIIVLAGGYTFFFNKTTAITPKYQLSTVTRGTISTSVSSTGQVTVANQIDIKPRVSGILKTLNVKNGQKVHKNDVIAILDNSDALKTVRNASLDLQNAQLSLQKTQQPNDQYTIDSAKSDIEQARLDLKKLQDPPTSLDLQQAENAVTQAERNIIQAQNNLDKTTLTSTQNLQTAYNKAHSALNDVYLNTSEIKKTDLPKFLFHIDAYRDLLNKDIWLTTEILDNYNAANSSYDHVLTQYNSKIQSSDEQSTYVNTLLADTLDMQQTFYKSLQSCLAVFDKIRNMTDYETFSIATTIDSLRPTLITDINTVNANISNLQSAKISLQSSITNSPFDLISAQAAISAAKEALKEKQLALTKLKAGATAEDLATAQEKVRQRQQALDKLLQGATALDLKSAQLSVQSKQNSLADAKEQLSYYTVKAPFDGVISTVPVVTSDMVSSGTTIATLINSQTMAQVSLNEVEAAKIKVGNPAMMTFDAVDSLTLSGTVSEIDSVGTVTQGVVSFNVKIALDTSDDRVKPGMSVNTDIITSIKQDILQVPNGAIKTQNGKSYVETLDNVSPVTDSSGAMTITTAAAKARKSIETGLSNDTYTEITSGLNEGELVISKTLTNSTTTNKSSTTSTSTRSATSILGGGGGFGAGGPPPGN